ncbi:Mfa1 family fimbria major subunit [Bacteroides sp. 519]|uniref:Mfa1 family fimbria major subunit n=1 Tax=Bacteroides sp. 519 TaxID=2302937 RepID=UPI0013D712D3|nr:Mfa1 family fimbria major subunit [Bacteroides sp. 519]NDV56946.1 hypothetical protein [Bacteroides sp. 519]
MRTNLFKQMACSITIIAGLLLASCSNENLGIDENNPDETPTEKGYISMSIINSAVANNTRAYGGTVTGTAEEGKVNSAMVVLYNAATNKVAYRFILDLTTEGLASKKDIYDITDSKYTTQPKEVARKDYKLAVFLNYPETLVTLTEPGSALSALQNPVSMSVESLIGTNKDNFLMSNFAGLININNGNIKMTKEEAIGAPVHLYVERAVAKIQVLLDSNFNTSNSTSGLRWQVDVVRKKTYWMRKQTKRLQDASGSGALIDEEVGIDHAMRIYMYAESPNYSQISASYWDYQTNVLGKDLGYGKPNPADHYTYITDTANVNLMAKSKSGSGDITYVLENTMAPEEQWEDVTTSILVRVYYQPKGGTALGGPLGKDGGTYFVYKNRYVFSCEEMEKIYSGTHEGWANLEAKNSDIKGFRDYIRSPEVSEIFGGANKDYVDIPDKSIQEGDLIFRLSNNLQFYRIPIRHFSNALQPVPMGYGRFGVVRNNMYKLTINGVNALGDLEIPPKDKVDEGALLSVKFEILPWITRDQGVIL